MKIAASLTLEKVLYDQSTDAHMVLSMTAPPIVAEARRPPLCIIPIIDLSGSMAGEKLTYAKRSLVKLIDHLSANDRCGLILFSNTAEVVSRPGLCTAEFKRELQRKVVEMNVRNSTNIADALLEGCRLANEVDLPAEVLTRIILFTDGAANVGPATTPDAIRQLVQPQRGVATLSAFGYGLDAMHDFLLALSKDGNGNYAFVQNPDDALTAFAKELGGLLTTYATNLVVEVSPIKGHQITKVVSDVDAEGQGQALVTIKIPDLLSEETRQVVLAVKLTEQKNALPRAVNAFSVKVSYDVLDQTLQRERKTVELKVKAQFVKDGAQDTKPKAELDRLVGLAEIVRAQLDADSLVKQGNYVRASQVMTVTLNNLCARGLNDLGAVAAQLNGCVSSAANYASSAQYRSSISKGATRAVGGKLDDFAEQQLKAAGVVITTATQDCLVQSFTGSQGSSGGTLVGGFVANPPQPAKKDPDPKPEAEAERKSGIRQRAQGW